MRVMENFEESLYHLLGTKCLITKLSEERHLEF